MKNLITILIVLVVAGCGKSEVEKLEAAIKEEKHKLDTAEKNKKLKALPRNPQANSPRRLIHMSNHLKW